MHGNLYGFALCEVTGPSDHLISVVIPDLSRARRRLYARLIGSKPTGRPTLSFHACQIVRSAILNREGIIPATFEPWRRRTLSIDSRHSDSEVSRGPAIAAFDREVS